MVKIRVGYKSIAFRHRQGKSFTEKMDMIGAQVLVIDNIGLCENIERHQGGNALAIGWNLVHPVTTIVGTDRVYPFGTVSGEIFKAKQPLVGLTETHYFLAYFALVKNITALFGNQSQTTSQMRLSVYRTCFRCLTINQIGSRCLWGLAE